MAEILDLLKMPNGAYYFRRVFWKDVEAYHVPSCFQGDFQDTRDTPEDRFN